MTEAYALQVVEGGELERDAAVASAGENGNGADVGVIEIVAPDGYSAGLLMEHAAPWFDARIAPGSECRIWLQPPSGGIWVFELIALVERWLDAAELSCAKLSYGQHSYLIRASVEHGAYDADVAASEAA